MRTIFCRLINSCWFFFRGGAALLALAAGIGVWYYVTRFDDEIRRQVQARLAANYPQLEVTVRAAQRVAGEGIVVRGVSLVERGADGPQAELVYVDELFLACPTDVRELVSGDLPIRSITVRRPTLRATRRPDGTWSVAKLLPLPHCGRQRPQTTIENASVEVFDPQRTPAVSYTLRNVNLALHPVTEPNNAPLPSDALGANTSKSPSPSPPLVALPPPGGMTPTDSLANTRQTGEIEFEGSLAGDLMHRTEFHGRLNPQTGKVSLGGRAEQLEIGPELCSLLPASAGSAAGYLSALRGQLDLTLRLDVDPSQPVPYRFDVQGQLNHGRIDDPRLPYPVTDIVARIQVSNNGFRVDDVMARAGLTMLSLNCQGQGLSSTSPITLTADARKFMLERQLVDLLPPTWQQIWYQYLPAGEVNLRFSLDFDGQRWTPKLDAQCVDVSFSHHKFPYRLERASGNLAFADNKLALRLRAFGDGRPVDIDGQIEHPGPASTGVVTINTTELPVSSRLMDALPGKSQTVVRSLAPQGTINAQVRVSRQVATDKWHQQIAVDLNRIAIRYEKFAYPLKDVRGRLEGVDGQWTFRDLVGTNDTGYVTCSGQFVPSPGGGELTLRFDGTDVPLGEELRGALSPRLQDFWLRLKPRGSVNLTSQLRYASPAKTLDVTVHIEPCNDSVSLEPDFFPYQLAKLSGAIDYHNGLVELHRVGAEHGRTQVVTDGHCRVGPDGGWDLRLENFTVDRLLPERELLAALPPRLRKGIAELNFDGPLNLRGNWALSRGGRPEDPLLSQWDVEFSTLQGRLHAGIELKNLAGGVRLIGQFDGTKQQMRGWLDIDSAMYGDYQLTHIRGPMWLSDDQFLLGAWAEPSNPGTAPNRLTAQAYGGVIAADIRVTLGGTPQFNVVAEAERVDLARLITETTRNGTRLQGNVAANIELSGTAAGTHRLSGSGGIRLQNGDIYELPLLVSLLKILSVRPPDKKAFSSSEMNFRIRADHIYFDKINFYGDAISMLGKGEMDFDRNVHMKFHAMVGSDQMHIPILRPVLGLASQQLMQVYVEGPLDHPHTSREALPGVRRVLEEFQGEIEDPHGVAPLMRVGEGGLTPAATPRATGP